MLLFFWYGSYFWINDCLFLLINLFKTSLCILLQATCRHHDKPRLVSTTVCQAIWFQNVQLWLIQRQKTGALNCGWRLRILPCTLPRFGGLSEKQSQPEICHSGNVNLFKAFPTYPVTVVEWKGTLLLSFHCTASCQHPRTTGETNSPWGSCAKNKLEFPFNLMKVWVIWQVTQDSATTQDTNHSSNEMVWM